jgi:hypothetical protein
MLKNILMATACAVLVSATPAIACDPEGKSGYLPENDLYIGVNDKMGSDMTEERFNEIIDRVDAIYAPIVRKRGGRLNWARNWEDGTVNASAQRILWTYQVNMYGGLARHQLVTDDAFAMVVCHELGHHLAGAPKVGGMMMNWASNEGQSDYFAALKCFRKVYESDNNQQIVAKMNVPAIVSQKCSDNFTSADDVALCIRTSMAGKSLADLLGSLRNSPETNFETPDMNIVAATDNKHPAAQCRLDTYFQGAICDKRHTDDVSKKDPLKGTCNRSQNYVDGVRPLCWYAPKK